ncbi:MAG: LytR/AlgR family response regulator transcription factor [Salinivirgaceae bacterium]
MKVLIVEDEVYNQRMLQGMLKQLRPHWTIAAITDSVADTVAWLQNNHPDLIFMDIQLVDGICFSIFERIPINQPIVFTTAYDNFAIQAFKVNSIHYLLKPIKEQELEQAIGKFEQNHKTTGTEANFSELLKAIRDGEKKYRTRFLIQGGTAYYKLEVNDIAYFYSENKITFAVLFQGKEHVVDFTLDALEEELNPDVFFRANRQLMVAINAVQKFEDYFGGKLALKLTPPFKETVTVSRLKNTAFKTWFGK